MDDRPIKKPNGLFPKMFKTFTLYIFATALVFFGYVQLFGDIKPNIISLPTDSSEAEDDTAFGAFVQSIMDFENIDTDIKLSFSNADNTINLALQGNVVYAESGISMDIDLVYNNQTFDVQATYAQPNLFLTIDESTFKFDTSTIEMSGGEEVDIGATMEMVFSMLNIDASFIADIENMFGIDFENFNPNDLLAKLKIEEKELEDGGHNFRIRLGSTIDAELICDQNYNIVSAKTNNILIKNNSLKFSANVNKMNNTDVTNGQSANVEVVYEESGDEVDLSGFAKYATCAKKLFANNCVEANVVLSNGAEAISAKVFVDLTDGVKVNFQTKLDAIDVEVTYADEIVYLDVQGLKFSFAVKDFDLWKEKIDAIVMDQTGKSIEDLLESTLSAYIEIGEDFDVNAFAMGALAKIFAGADKVSTYLPNKSELTENSYCLIWEIAKEEGVKEVEVELTSQEGILESVKAKYDSLEFLATFAVTDARIEVSGEYFDLTRLLPVVDVVEEILKTKQFGGTLGVVLDGEKIEAEYVVDLKDGVLAQISTRLFGEDVCVYVNGEQILLSVGEIVLEGDLANIEDYIAKVEAIFGLGEIAQGNGETETSAISSLIAIVAQELKNLHIALDDSALMVVEYLSARGALSVVENVATIKVDYEEISATATLTATEKEIVLPQNAESVDSVFEKIENVKDFVESEQYAFAFAISSIEGYAQIDLKNNRYEIGVKIGESDLVVRYEDEIAYVEYAGHKIKVATNKVDGLLNAIMAILNANTQGETTAVAKEDVDFVKDLLVEVFGEDLSSLTISELLNKISIDLAGVTDNLTLSATINSVTPVTGTIVVKFVDDMIDTLNVAIGEDVNATLKLRTFDLTALTAEEQEEYFNLLTQLRGTAQITYKDEAGDVHLLDVTIEVDLTDGVYARVSTAIFDVSVEIVVIDNLVYATIGDLSVSADLCEAKELYCFIAERFGIEIPQTQLEIADLLTALQGFEFKEIAGLTFAIDGQEMNIQYTCDKIALDFHLFDERVFDHVAPPQATEDLKSFLTKVDSVIEFVKSGRFEFSLAYNGLTFDGLFNFANGELAIVAEDVCGETFSIRLHENVIYVAYGNMKIKADLSTSNSEQTDIFEQINKLTSGEFGFVLDFGVFREILNILENYTLQDYLDKIVLDISANADQISVDILHRHDIMLPSEIVRAQLHFGATNALETVNLSVYENVVTAEIKSTEKVIEEFDPADYADYSDNFVDGLFDSLQVEQGVYAFSSDIAIRYSTTTFYGQLSALLVEEVVDGVTNYTPALSIYTTALGLSSYIYLVGETIYIDLNGLQIQADLNETTINEIMDFVYANFGQFIDGGDSSTVTEQAEALEQTAEAFKVLLPAIDQIYGSWVRIISDGKEFKGIQINFKDDLWYAETSRFYDIVAQVFVENYENTIVPTQIVLGANIEDPNTTLYDDYSAYLLKDGDGVRETVTTQHNFAVYLDNVLVGRFVEGLHDIFVSDTAKFENISALKSNYGTTEIADYNEYQTLLDFVETVYDYGMSYQYQLGIDASVESDTSSLKVNGGVRVELSDLTEDEKNSNIFTLFSDKSMKVQGDLSFTVDTVEHLLSLLYESNDTSALYATYTHGEYIASGDKFRAKINNTNLSEIISMVLKFADIDIGEDMTNALNLQPCTTDFEYIQHLLGIGGADVGDDISKADQILSSVESVTKLINNIRLQKTLIENETDLYQTTLSVRLDLDANDPQKAGQNFGTASIVIREERQEDGTIGKFLREISLENFVVSGSTINATIFFNDFENGAFDYLSKNPEGEHIDFSELSSFVDIAVNTINTRGFNFSGSADVSIIGIDAITVEYDLHVTLDKDGKIYFYMEVSVPSFADVTYDLGGFGSTFTYYSAGVGFDNRISVLEYVDDTLTVTQTTYGFKKTAFNSKETKVKTWTHSKDEIGSQMMTILAETLGITDTVYNSISGLIESMNPNPSLEKTILGFAVTENGYILSLDGETLTGDSNFGDMDVVLGLSQTYSHNGKDYKFIDSVSTMIDISNGTLKIPVELKSNSGTTKTTFSGVDLHTNDYFRKIYAYQVHSIQFEENCAQHVSDIIQSAGEEIELPNLETYSTDDGTVKTTFTFDGWWTTPTFEDGTAFTSNIMPNKDLTLYAKWNADKIYYRTVTFQTNAESITEESVTQLEGSTFELPSYETYVVDDGITKTTRVFAGWWTTADFEEGTQFTSNIVPSVDTTLYAKWNDATQYYRTISFVTNCGTSFEDLTKLEGEAISLPTLTTKEETVENSTTYFQFEGWFTDETFENEFTSTSMPTQNVTLYAKWNVMKVETTYALLIYDNEQLIYSARVKGGDALNLSERLDNVDEYTKFYLDATYTNEFTGSTMPEGDLTLHIRNKYDLTYTYYVLLNNTYVQTTYTASLYQGETFTLAEQNDTYIDYYNSNGELSYRTYFTFGDYVYNGSVVTSNAMPNHDFTFGNTMTTETKNYYKVVFDVRQYRTASMWAGSYSWESTPVKPDSIYLFEGDAIDLKQETYQPTCYGKKTWAASKTLFKATSWGLSAWSDGTSGGSGFTSYTISSADASDGYTITLYACWEKQ